MPKAKPPEFRRRAVELARLREKPVREIASDLGFAESCLRRWRQPADVDQGQREGCRRTSVRSWFGCVASCA
jgi:transposase